MPPIGQIILFPYDFAPRGFSFCSGNLIPIFQNQQLFKYLGTAYGGDGQSTFCLPDIDNLAPPNCHYCIAMEGTVGRDYKGYLGESFPLPNNAEAGNVEKCNGQRLAHGIQQVQVIRLLTDDRQHLANRAAQRQDDRLISKRRIVRLRTHHRLAPDGLINQPMI